MDLDEMIEEVDGPESFLSFLRLLLADRRAEDANDIDACGRGPNGWENHTIEAFLEAAIAWGEDTNIGATQGMSDFSAWQRCAALLYCGKIYE